MIQRLGDPERGRQLVQASGAAVAEVLLEGLPEDEDTVASQLERLRTEAADERPLSTRTSTLVELGLSYLYDLDNPTRALAAFDAALDQIPLTPWPWRCRRTSRRSTGVTWTPPRGPNRRRDATRSPSVLAVCSLDLADATDEPDHRIEHLKTAHRALWRPDPPPQADPGELRLRAEATNSRISISASPSSPPTRSRGRRRCIWPCRAQSTVQTPCRRSCLAWSRPLRRSPSALAPMCEIATALERELSREESAPWSRDLGIARTTLDTLDDPRERAVLLKLIWSRRVGRQPGEGS